MLSRLCLAAALLGPGCQAVAPKDGDVASIPCQARQPSQISEALPAKDASDLAQAAACLQRGDEAAACALLARHIEANPHHVSLRAQYAELLFGLDRLPEARHEFERFAAVAQERGDRLLPLMVHAHSRLAELAERREDDYEAHLQRGLGLYWLARRCGLPAADAELSVEGLYFKAAGELLRAHRLQPREARPCWYLYLTWRDMARQQFAQRWLRDTRELAGDSYLTPGEQRRLHLACQAQDERR